jgi:6-phosphogluconolactonase
VSESEQQSYDIDPLQATPDLPGSVRVGEDIEQTLDFVAADLFVQSNNCVSSFGDFHLALTHGTLQERLLIKLMVDPKYRSMPWERTHIWSVTESCVAPGHQDHSMTHWNQIIRGAASVPIEQLHSVHGHLPEAATLYGREFTSHLEWRERGHDRLDFVLFGPELATLGSTDDPAGQLVTHCEKRSQVLMTSKLLNASRMIAIVGAGPSGRSIVDIILEDSQRIGLSPTGGVMRWYLDEYACRHTQEESM